MTDMQCYYDPRCPWTWRAARWLQRVRATEPFNLEWRAFNLALLHDPDLDPQEMSRDGASRGLRLVEALHVAGCHADADAFVFRLGERVHDDGEELTPDLAREVADELGVDGAEALDDPRWDDAQREALEAALAAAGPDVGSPVLTLAGYERGLHGPILAEVPDGDAGRDIWRATITLLERPEFYEIKRGRPG
jgi:hypothetical protein